VTVSVTDLITPRPWRGYDDPGLPVGMYFAQNAVTGNASGGDMIVFFTFKEEGGPITGRFYNVEQYNVFHSASAGKSGHMVATNWESVSPAGLVNRQWRYELAANADGGSAEKGDVYIPMPLFLGAAAPLVDLKSTLEFGIDNVDLTSLVVSIQGYIWEARSMQAEGGLRRPADSLYGRS